MHPLEGFVIAIFSGAFDVIVRIFPGNVVEQDDPRIDFLVAKHPIVDQYGEAFHFLKTCGPGKLLTKLLDALLRRDVINLGVIERIDKGFE
ncbi:hypothetical protein D3C83_76470 [compost metagenome]